MRLRSKDGTQLGLAIRGYQFPDIQGSEAHDWDANWLVVSGEVILGDGRQHTFTEACMTTWEAAEFRDWLTGLTSGSVSREVEGPDLVFTEPCLAFAASALEGDNIEIRAYLSLEAEPPFVVATAAGLFKNS